MKNKEIAKILGISEAMVSLTLNHKPGVSEAMRERIFRLIEENDPEAKKRKKENSKNLLLLSVHKKNGQIIDSQPFFAQLIETIQNEAERRSRTLMLTHFTPEMNITDYIDYIGSMSCDGIILIATELEDKDVSFYKRLNVPMVILDNSLAIDGMDIITQDTQASFVKSVEYAYKKGHRKIGYLQSMIRTNNFDKYYIGYEEGMMKQGIWYDKPTTFQLTCTINDSYKQMKSILQKLPGDFEMPTCFLADQDYIAIGAMQAFKEMGYQVPEQVSFIGYGDIPSCGACSPTLTTVRVNNEELGRLAVKRLTKKIRNPEQTPLRIQVPSEFIERNSVYSIGKPEK